MIEYLSHIFPVNFFEIIAFSTAIITMIKYKAHFGLPERVIVFYLFLTALVELVGLYPHYVFDQQLETTAFFKAAPQFLKSYWLYNIYSIIATVCFGYYYTSKLLGTQRKIIARGLLILFIVSAIVNLVLTDIFYEKYSVYTDFASVLILTTIIGFFYYEILTSDKILDLKRSFSFIISIPIFLFYIGITPIFMLSDFYASTETAFAKFYRAILDPATYLLYTMFILAYLWCYWFNKSLKKK